MLSGHASPSTGCAGKCNGDMLNPLPTAVLEHLDMEATVISSKAQCNPVKWQPKKMQFQFLVAFKEKVNGAADGIREKENRVPRGNSKGRKNRKASECSFTSERLCLLNLLLVALSLVREKPRQSPEQLKGTGYGSRMWLISQTRQMFVPPVCRIN